MVIDRDCVVGGSRRGGEAKSAARGEVCARILDLAVGPSFRGAHQPLSPFSTPPPLFADHVDDGAPRQIVAMSAIILSAYLQVLP
jgi:hypothetical protein